MTTMTLFDSEGFTLSVTDTVLSVFCKAYMSATESGISEYNLMNLCGRTVVNYNDGVVFFTRYVEHVPTEAYPLFIALLPSF